MNTGKVRQLMETCHGLLNAADGGGDHRVRTLSVRRAIHAASCPADLPAKPARRSRPPLGPRIKLYHMGSSRCSARRWGDANERRDGVPCGGPAHHPGETHVRRRRTGVPDQYRLPLADVIIALCLGGLSVGAARTTGSGKMHTNARPRGNAEFYPPRGWQAARRRPYARRKPEPSTAGSRLRFARHVLPKRGLLRHASEHRMLIASIRRRRIARPAHGDTSRTLLPRQDSQLLRRIRFKDPESGKRWSSSLKSLLPDGPSKRHEAELIDEAACILLTLRNRNRRFSSLASMSSWTKRRRDKADGEAFLTSRQTEAEGDMGFAGALFEKMPSA